MVAQPSPAKRSMRGQKITHKEEGKWDAPVAQLEELPTDWVQDVGLSPLFLAAWRGHLEVFKELIAKGADVNQKANNGMSPWMEACGEGHLGVGEATASNGFTGLIFASSGGKTNVVRFLLSKGARVDRTNKKGQTALDVAVAKRHKEIVGLLTRHASASAH
ncbi:hypothetical protein GPALN_009810 [Globodera pallida]|nr:hypothetical protein GPALN_009810 [Globodera pallida]